MFKELIKISKAKVNMVNKPEKLWLGSCHADKEIDINEGHAAIVKHGEQALIQTFLHEEAHLRLRHWSRLCEKFERTTGKALTADRDGTPLIDLSLSETVWIHFTKAEHEAEANFCEENLAYMLLTDVEAEKYLKTIEAPEHILSTINDIWNDIKELEVIK